MFDLELFPARDGDALILTWGDEAAPHRMLIDCGREGTWKAIKAACHALPEAERTFELLVVTHIDSDHIAGILSMLADPKRPINFKDVWFNAYHHLVGGTWESFGARQGENLSDHLKKRLEVWNRAFDGNAVVIEPDMGLPRVNLAGLELTLLSPTRSRLEALAPVWKSEIVRGGLGRRQKPLADPALVTLVPDGYEAFGPTPDVKRLAREPEQPDTAAPNGSSIAFAAAFEGKRVLLCADAHPTVLEASLRSLPEAERRFDLMKLSHHGSRGNLTKSLLDAIECQRFAVSTDGSRHDHPHPEAIAWLLAAKRGPKSLYFNYRNEQAFQWKKKKLMDELAYKCHFPHQHQDGRMRISI